MIWKVLKPFDWLLERLAGRAKPTEPEREQERSPVYSHPVWLRGWAEAKEGKE